MAGIKYQEALGLEVKIGRPVLPRPSCAKLRRLYVQKKKTIREVAKELGLSKYLVHQTLKTCGIEIRSCVRKSALLAYSLRELEAGVRDKGLRGFAREIGFSPGTILHHLAIRKGKQ